MANSPSFRARLELPNSLFFYLIRLENDAGQFRHCIFAIRGDKANGFEQAVMQDGFNPNEWGQIVREGPGPNPSQETLQELEQLFGIAVDFSKDNIIHLEDALRRADEGR